MNSNDKHLRSEIHDIIFKSDTKVAKTFDIILLILILISVIAVMLDSISSVREAIGRQLFILEWAVTILFTIEYILRIWTSEKPLKYIFSFFGIIDLLAILPTYLSLILVGYHYLIVIRILRILRIFRVLKLGRFMKASSVLVGALKESRHKIIVFLEVIFTVVVIVGSLMYLIEGPENGFTSIPRGIYWSIVTLTTVGYGDITPATPLGQALSALIMIMGYAIIAVPTGIITTEMVRLNRQETDDVSQTKKCPDCKKPGHSTDAQYCKYCGEKL